MQNDIALFWAVLAGLLVVDNFILVPCGGDYVKFGRTGRFLYEPSTRLQALGRDLVLLNPLNPFDRLALTSRSIGPLTAVQFRSSQKRVRGAVSGLNVLSWLGSGYLAVLFMLMALSLYTYFGLVLALLAGAHVLTWGACLTVLVKHQTALGLSRYQTFALAAEAFFVPGYLVNLGKRVWYKRSLDMPALTLGLKQARHMPDDPTRELYCLRLLSRLDAVAFELGLSTDGTTRAAPDPRASTAPQDATPADQQQSVALPPAAQLPRANLQLWLESARLCLTTSAA